VALAAASRAAITRIPLCGTHELFLLLVQLPKVNVNLIRFPRRSHHLLARH
jgi:hypothetical protein